MTCIVDYASRGIRVTEDALTFQVLTGLQDSTPTLGIHDFGGTSVESRTGADWEWWIEGEGHWFNFLVQAKRLRTFGKRRGYGLGHLVGGRRQVDLLVRESLRRGVPAMYALYNPAGVSDDYCSSDCMALDICLPRNAHGITMLAAEVAQQLVLDQLPRGRTVVDVPLSEVAPKVVPWTCLVGCLNECDIASPLRNPALPMTAHSPQMWAALGLSGPYRSDDMAFRFAAMTVALNADESDGQAVERAIAQARSGFVEEAPGYVLEPTVAALAQRDRDAEYSPALLVITRRTRDAFTEASDRG